MPLAFYIVPATRRNPPVPAWLLYEMYPAIQGQDDVIQADGGRWRCMPLRGRRYLVKVRASAETLAILDGLYKRIPLSRLDDPIGSLSAAARLAIRNEIIDQGYRQADIDEAFPDGIQNHTLREILVFMARGWRAFQYNAQSDDIDETEEIIDQSGALDSVDEVN